MLPVRTQHINAEHSLIQKNCRVWVMSSHLEQIGHCHCHCHSDWTAGQVQIQTGPGVRSWPDWWPKRCPTLVNIVSMFGISVAGFVLAMSLLGMNIVISLQAEGEYIFITKTRLLATELIICTSKWIIFALSVHVVLCTDNYNHNYTCVYVNTHMYIYTHTYIYLV